MISSYSSSQSCPTSIAVDIYKRRKRCRRKDQDEYDAILDHLSVVRRKRKVVDDANISQPRKRKNPPTKGYMYVVGDNGALRLGTPQDSLWWVNYVLLPPELLTTRQRMKFRRRYRMPYESWKDFVVKLNSSPILKTWRHGNKDCTGQPASPLELLSLGALKYLGRKCSFDDLEELTFISERTHERFFRKFIEFGDSTLYPEYVQTLNEDDNRMQMQMEMMDAAGFAGCCSSSDATHVPIEMCKFGMRQMHKGWKLDKTARTYNISVTRWRRVLSSTKGHPSRWNDKSIVWFDDFQIKMKEGRFMPDFAFELLERDTEGNIITKKYKGVWSMVDNGYHLWPTTVPPFTYCTSIEIVRWSQWLESMRKDVECTIGIIKKRWTILSKGLQAHSIELADKVWTTCLALHNMLLEVDGYDEMWLPEHMSHDSDEQYFSLNRLRNPDVDARPIERTSQTSNPSTSETVNNDSVTKVCDMDFHVFRQKLVHHFDILFKDYQIAWPVNVRVPRSI